MVRARNDGEQFERCGLAGQSEQLQHFSTFSPRMYCSVAYWQSYGGGAGIWKQATFLNVGKSSQGGTFEENFARWLVFHSPYAHSQAKTGGEGPSLSSTPNKISQRHGLRKVSDKGESPNCE